MLQANPGLTPDQIKTLLETSATLMPGFALHEVGAGYLNAYDAVTQALALGAAVTRVEERATLLAPAGAPQ